MINNLSNVLNFQKKRRERRERAKEKREGKVRGEEKGLARNHDTWCRTSERNEVVDDRGFGAANE